jgi:hypothetical protein
LAVTGPRLARRDLRLVSTAGYALAARITEPATPGPHPGLVVSPAIHQGLAGLESWGSPVTAPELARLGYAVLTFDPAGRGASWGEDDHGGPEHADDVRVAVLALREHGVRDVGVLSLSLGVAAAAAALARWPGLDVRWLVDWEGPSDREVITAGGTRMTPAAGHGLDDDTYWVPREAVRHVAALRCGYVRLQAHPDHAQPNELRHAERMLDAARAAPGMPWWRFNDHAPGVGPAEAGWHAGGTRAANRLLLRVLEALRDP